MTLYTFSKPTITIDGITVKSKLPFKMPTLGLYQRSSESKLLDSAKHNDIIIQASGGITIPENTSQKIVVYCHGDLQDESSKTSSKYKGIWKFYHTPYEKSAKKSLENIACRNVNLISNSHFVRSSILNNLKKDSVVIYPPVDIASFGPDSKKSNDIITVSRYSPEKNLDFALDTIAPTGHSYTVIGNTKTKSNVLYFRHLNSKSRKNNNIILEKNILRRTLVEKLNGSRVYFHACEETFGIAVVEGIAAGCVPVVPDNGAHKETVPVDDLRYVPDDSRDAAAKIQRALSGEFDHHMPRLQENILKYSEANFRRSFRNFVENLAST